MCAAPNIYLNPTVWYTSLGPIVGVSKMSSTVQESAGKPPNRRVSAVSCLLSPVSSPLVFKTVLYIAYHELRDRFRLRRLVLLLPLRFGNVTVITWAEAEVLEATFHGLSAGMGVSNMDTGVLSISLSSSPTPATSIPNLQVCHFSPSVPASPPSNASSVQRPAPNVQFGDRGSGIDYHYADSGIAFFLCGHRPHRKKVIRRGSVDGRAQYPTRFAWLCKVRFVLPFCSERRQPCFFNSLNGYYCDSFSTPLLRSPAAGKD